MSRIDERGKSVSFIVDIDGVSSTTRCCYRIVNLNVGMCRIANLLDNRISGKTENRIPDIRPDTKYSRRNSRRSIYRYSTPIFIILFL